MSDFTIKSGGYCPVCRGMVLRDCSHTMSELRSAASGDDALAAERDALRRDAERYRWLRDSAGNDIMEKLMAECSPPRWDELVDAAIDAAMGERP